MARSNITLYVEAADYRASVGSDAFAPASPEPPPRILPSTPRRAPFFLCRDQYLPRCHGNGGRFFPGRVSPLGLFMLSAAYAAVDGRRKEPEDGSFEGRRHQMKPKGHDTQAGLAFVLA